MLTEEYREYQADPLSLRKAINCCGLSNALPEAITAHKNPDDCPKALKPKVKAYRDSLKQRCEAHHTVRDFCDYSKHVKLSRRDVSVNEVERIRQKTGSPIGLTLIFTHSHDTELLVLRHQDDREEYMEVVLREVIASWKAILEEDNL